MQLPIYRTTDEAVVDDDERLLPLLGYRWIASYNKGHIAEGIGPKRRRYYYPRRHERKDGRRISETLARAVLRLLGETVPAGHRVWHRDGNPLNCRRANLVIAAKPPGGWLIPAFFRRKPA